jgi:2-succinyl-6-hydroxy-2,4-cyclohexadiene-1-carboxylate synthase
VDVVLLHGFTQTGASWEPVVSGLGSGVAVAPDIRGHGAASSAEPVTLDAVAGDVGRFAPARFALVGYSMGGRIALHVALALRERVERLVLVGASPGIADGGEREARLRADLSLADEIEGLSIEEFAARWARTSVLAGQPASVRSLVNEDRRRNTPAGLARALRGLGTGALPSLWDRLGELTMPVALVVGERDEKFSAIALQMAGAIERSEVVVVAGAGHAVHLEAPAAVAEVIEGGPAPIRG